MSNRPGSSAGRPGTAQRGVAGGVIPQGTATRLMTAANPGTARPGSRAGVTGGGVALNAQLHVADRPVTQQGLGAPKTAANRGGQRLVQDKTYFLGLLRQKVNDLQSENSRLASLVVSATQDQASYVSYEKRAEVLAREFKELQAELGDYNTLVDKLNTDANINDMQMDYNDNKAQNDREALSLDSLFEQKQHREQTVLQLEEELKQVRNLTDSMITDMPGEMRRKYNQLKDLNEHLLKQLESGEQELCKLKLKLTELEEELNMSPVKQEAVRLYEQLQEIEEKRDQLMAEVQAKGTPQEERERLLKQVKEDNSEIASMERHTNELKEKLASLQEELQQAEMDQDENHGEKSQQYRELKKREEVMDEFLRTFDETRAQDMERVEQLQKNIVELLKKISRNMGRSTQLPTPQELDTMKDDLAFKQKEMQKSEMTTGGLAQESAKLQADLQKFDQMETKMKEELRILRDKNEKMIEDLQIFSDLRKLKEDSEAKKEKLGTDKVILHRRREVFKRMMQQLSVQYEQIKAQLHENETFAQLTNMERKWQQQEQNNFVVKEFVASKSRETDYRETCKRVVALLTNHNKNLIDQASGKAPRRL